MMRPGAVPRERHFDRDGGESNGQTADDHLGHPVDELGPRPARLILPQTDCGSPRCRGRCTIAVATRDSLSTRWWPPNAAASSAPPTRTSTMPTIATNNPKKARSPTVPTGIPSPLQTTILASVCAKDHSCWATLATTALWSPTFHSARPRDKSAMSSASFSLRPIVARVAAMSAREVRKSTLVWESETMAAPIFDAAVPSSAGAEIAHPVHHRAAET